MEAVKNEIKATGSNSIRESTNKAEDLTCRTVKVAPYLRSKIYPLGISGVTQESTGHNTWTAMILLDLLASLPCIRVKVM